jgi:hypothetical protein
MTPQNHDDLTDQLGRAMHDRADGISHAPITLGDVKGTATRIRRRRAIAASAAVAAAVAIIVPTVAINSSMFQKADDNHNIATNSAAPTPTDVKLGEPLDVSNLKLGDAPRIDWIENGTTLHTADGGTVTLDRSYSDVVRYDDGWLGKYTDDEGVATGVLLDADGNPTGEQFRTAYFIAVSSDEEQVLFVRNGSLVLHDNVSGEDKTIRTDVGPQIEPIAVTADTAYYNVQVNLMDDGRWWRDGVEHDPRPDGLYSYADATEDGWTVATDEVTDFGSCSVVTSPEGDQAGRTCKLTLKAFAPDGNHILAGAAYEDGYASRQLSVTNRDGVGTEAAVVLEYIQTGEQDASFMNYRWEDDSHILAVMTTPIAGTSDRTWSLVRIGLDGSAEYAAPSVRGEELPRFAPFAIS